MTMKLIRCDNLDREGPGHNDILIAIFAENMPKHVLCEIAERLNETRTGASDDRDYYRVVSDDYKLKIFEP